jgi:hypothetical protein
MAMHFVVLSLEDLAMSYLSQQSHTAESKSGQSLEAQESLAVTAHLLRYPARNVHTVNLTKYTQSDYRASRDTHIHGYTW